MSCSVMPPLETVGPWHGMQYLVKNGTTAVVNVVVATGFLVAFCWTFATCDADASGHTIARVAIGVIVATTATMGPTYFILTPCNTKFFPSEEPVIYGSARF